MPDQPTDVTTQPAPDPVRDRCASRRQVLRAAGAVAVVPAAAGTLAACGPEEASRATVAGDGTVTVPAADTAVGAGTYYGEAQVVVTHPAEGDYRAFDATCTHQGCATSAFDDGVIVCPCHGSEFDPATGEVVRGPAETGLTALTATLDGGDLVIRG